MELPSSLYKNFSPSCVNQLWYNRHDLSPYTVVQHGKEEQSIYTRVGLIKRKCDIKAEGTSDSDRWTEEGDREKEGGEWKRERDGRGRERGRKIKRVREEEGEGEGEPRIRNRSFCNERYLPLLLRIHIFYCQMWDIRYSTHALQYVILYIWRIEWEKKWPRWNCRPCRP